PHVCPFSSDLSDSRAARDLDPGPRGGRAKLSVELGAIDNRDAFFSVAEREGPPAGGREHARRGAAQDQALRKLEEVRQLVGDDAGAVRGHPDRIVLFDERHIESSLGEKKRAVEAGRTRADHDRVEHEPPYSTRIVWRSIDINLGRGAWRRFPASSGPGAPARDAPRADRGQSGADADIRARRRSADHSSRRRAPARGGPRDSPEPGRGSYAIRSSPDNPGRCPTAGRPAAVETERGFRSMPRRAGRHRWPDLAVPGHPARRRRRNGLRRQSWTR